MSMNSITSAPFTSLIKIKDKLIFYYVYYFYFCKNND